ncbi:unnamed protein product [Linum trigynum]|uniref:Uncharacterized protein n=1 Tax=Linum trigynum TaxID=586398 RepID=A0AAV2GFY2_9ROSI
MADAPNPLDPSDAQSPGLKQLAPTVGPSMTLKDASNSKKGEERSLAPTKTPIKQVVVREAINPQPQFIHQAWEHHPKFGSIRRRRSIRRGRRHGAPGGPTSEASGKASTSNGQHARPTGSSHDRVVSTDKGKRSCASQSPRSHRGEEAPPRKDARG